MILLKHSSTSSHTIHPLPPTCRGPNVLPRDLGWGALSTASSLVSRDRLWPSKIRMWRVLNQTGCPETSCHPMPGQTAVEVKGRLGSVPGIKSWSLSFPRAWESQRHGIWHAPKRGKEENLVQRSRYPGRSSQEGRYWSHPLGIKGRVREWQRGRTSNEALLKLGYSSSATGGNEWSLRLR